MVQPGYVKLKINHRESNDNTEKDSGSDSLCRKSQGKLNKLFRCLSKLISDQ